MTRPGKGRETGPDKATIAQNRASEPLASTWLSANAGSGKTKVLTDRVARLLLAGVSPQNILCLTYTKAAASEMQNRLFELLGEWAMMPEADLRRRLAALGEAPGPDLHPVRSLFARAVETPGGLKIQTIHSFCAALLRRFPLEAGVSPQFVEMDERAAVILREEVVEAMALGTGADALAGLARFHSGQALEKLTEALVKERAAFRRPVEAAEVWQWCGLSPGTDAARITSETLAPGDDSLVAELRDILLAASSVSEPRVGRKLARYRPDLPPQDKLAILQAAFLTGKGTVSSRLLTRATKQGPAAHLLPAFEDLCHRLASSVERQNALITAEKTLALHTFAGPFLRAYEAAKQARGWLDFDDLISKAGDLLSEPALAAWVLYRLDGRIDHILVDEAQDTSPAQWRVIELLAQEFTSGESAREGERTIFVVGDPKQSIYSFQGAEPEAFASMKTHFASGLVQVGRGLQDLRLEYSFRSSAAVLGLVDHALDGLGGLGEAGFTHIPFFDKPGRVDLWPGVEKADYTETRHWADTTDTALPETHIWRLARAVAAEIARMLAEETLPGKDGTRRKVEPQDILILVRGRLSGLFAAVIRACKEAGLPIAGADVLELGAEMAVKDLTALLRFLATPEDDLSLAATLRSPLCGLSEAQLYAIAQPRPKGGYLWNALRAGGASFQPVVEMLDDLRKAADFLRPYELLERILTRHRGRARLLSRLGREAEDGIDALLAQALSFESTETPGLTGFLEWLDAMAVKVKRRMDNAGNLIRVMTVHGAKGLEAPIVFLPDCTASTPKDRSEFVHVGGRLIWKPLKDQHPPWLQGPVEALREADRRENARLLYVAATRAAHWLIVAAAGDTGKDGSSWYDTLARGMEQLGAVRQEFALGPGLRHQNGDWPIAAERTADEPGRSRALPAWAGTQPAAGPARPAPLAPSDLGGAKALPGEGAGQGAEAAMRRGRQLHLLLEILSGTPPENWPDLSRAVLAAADDPADARQADTLCAEATRLITAPDLAHVFAPGSLAEVDVTAHLPARDGAVMQGSIDRLVIEPHRVTIVDFKTNVLVPENPAQVPEGILRQMGAYIGAIGQIFPDREVKCAILWTTRAELMPIPTGLALASLSAP